MTQFESRKLIEMVLYILERTGGIDFYHVFKILYFAEMEHLAKWGSRIVPDEFRALKYGPVPSTLYAAIKELNTPKIRLAEELAAVTKFAGEDAPNVLLPKQKANLKFLSKSEIEALNKSIDENKSLTFTQLMYKSHDEAWSEANRRVNGNNIISPVSIAKILNADEAILEYIEEQLRIDSSLK